MCPHYRQTLFINLLLYVIIFFMKRILITVILCFFGMTVFTQDMSSYMSDFTRDEGTVNDRLLILETVRDAGLTGIGEFYHNALKYIYTRIPDVKTRSDEDALEKSVIILCQGLGAEKYTDAAPEIWYTADYFDVDRNPTNQGNAMQAALIALGQVNGKDYLPYILQRLNQYNSQTFRGDARNRIQMAVVGYIDAIESLKDISGYKPVFNVYVGSYDQDVQQIAYKALPNIVDDPSDVIVDIMHDPTNDAFKRLNAWNEMLRSNAPDSSKAKVALVAMALSWETATTDKTSQAYLGEMRKSAIDAIRQFGAADDIAYRYLDRAYLESFNTNNPDYPEIILTLDALSALKTDEAIGLLIKYLREVHDRRVHDLWGERERRLFQWLISCIAFTETSSADAKALLNTIQRTAAYTPFEQGLARTALAKLN